VRVVIDTNVFVSSFLNPIGNPRKVIDLWKTGKIDICISEEILEEYISVLARIGLEGEPELYELLERFKRKENIIFASNTPSITVIEQDPADNMFIECAVAVDAPYIISGDKHLTALKSYRGISIISLSEFIKKRKADWDGR